MKRFLRSIPVRKPYKEKKKQPKHPSLYIKGVKPDPALCQDLCVKLETEIKSNKPVKMEGDEVITVAMKSALEETVVLNRSEKIYKVSTFHILKVHQASFYFMNGFCYFILWILLLK